MRPGVSHLGGCVTARGPAQGPHLILRLILGASPGVCSELFREEPHSPLLSWDRERCRRSWKIEVIVTEPLLWQEHSCEDSFILVMNKRWEVSCSGIGTSTPDSADDCVDRWQLSASVFLAEQLDHTIKDSFCLLLLTRGKWELFSLHRKMLFLPPDISSFSNVMAQTVSNESLNLCSLRHRCEPSLLNFTFYFPKDYLEPK
ncbi:uncharacterized protein LOC129636178 isoform X5 [Bubalus kerabau]|uniref:uncharacterized protein LOC129636178 isoform X5 n=1 Tax=Bubalus carabanensis TaxID=3119969 RepID=UPI00244ED923|nr:uncharacterized protein LOC129636178 isoform X5 [Bubalus carabanensis]